jgi:hypothetical protein
VKDHKVSEEQQEKEIVDDDRGTEKVGNSEWEDD